MTIKHEIITYMVREGKSVQDICSALHKKYYASQSVSNFRNKLIRDSFRFYEVKQIADVLGYDIKWVKRKSK